MILNRSLVEYGLPGSSWRERRSDEKGEATREARGAQLNMEGLTTSDKQMLIDIISHVVTHFCQTLSGPMPRAAAKLPPTGAANARAATPGKPICINCISKNKKFIRGAAVCC